MGFSEELFAVRLPLFDVRRTENSVMESSSGAAVATTKIGGAVGMEAQ